MNKYYKKNQKKENYGYKQYNQKGNYYHQKIKRNQYNNNYFPYTKRKKNLYEYDTYEEEFSNDDRDTTYSANAPSTKDNSFSQSSNSNSRKHSYCENNNDSIENNKGLNFIIFDNESSRIESNPLPKINLSENDLKTAYFKPKNYKETSIQKEENKKIDKDENFVILEINIKLSKDKSIFFKLKKYDDMFLVAKNACKENEISEEYVNFFVYSIMKALNSIYGIYNLKLNEDEISLINKLKVKCVDN